MFERKLRSLDYPDDIAAINLDDTTHFRKLVVWLEDLKICAYSIDERSALRGTDNDRIWTKAFIEYLKVLECPFTTESPRSAIIDWLLGVAVSMKYSDENADSYKHFNTVSTQSASTPPTPAVSDNPLDKLDPQCPDFIAGVNELAQLLKMPTHRDHIITLQAASQLIQERLSKEAIAESKQSSTDASKRGRIRFSLDDCDLGFNVGSDPVLNKAAKGLRLLHIAELRQLQTGINETIVAVQQVTANPKTDEKLGQVGYFK